MGCPRPALASPEDQGRDRRRGSALKSLVERDRGCRPDHCPAGEALEAMQEPLGWHLKGL